MEFHSYHMEVPLSETGERLEGTSRARYSGSKALTSRCRRLEYATVKVLRTKFRL